MGKPIPVLSPEFLSLRISTALGLNGTSSVAILVALMIVFWISSWLSFLGTFTKKTGTPVSWQRGLSVFRAILIFSRIADNAVFEADPSFSAFAERLKASSTSCGKDVAAFL